MLAQYQQAIEQYRQRIYSFAHYSLRAREDAEDITQEVFIKLWQHWKKIDHNKLNAWLMRVAHNAVIDHVRRGKNQAEKIDDYAEPEDQASTRDEAGTRVDQEAFGSQLMSCISSLDDPFRSIIIMRDVQGMSYADIQHTLDMSESQVKVYLHRGRRKLRENETLRGIFQQMTGADDSLAPNSMQMKIVKPAADL